MRVRLLGAGLVLLLAGCGGASGLSPEGKLQDGLAAVIDAADNRNLTDLRSALADLRRTVRAELAAGQVTAVKARAILRAADAVEGDAELVTKKAAPVVTTAPATQAPPTSDPPSPTPTSPAPSPTPSPTPVATTPAPSPSDVLPPLLPTSPTPTGKGKGKRR